MHQVVATCVHNFVFTILTLHSHSIFQRKYDSIVTSSYKLFSDQYCNLNQIALFHFNVHCSKIKSAVMFPRGFGNAFLTGC